MSHASKPTTRARSSRSALTSQASAGKPWYSHWLVQLLPDLLLLLLFAIFSIFLFNLWWYVPPALRPGWPIGPFLDILRAYGLMPPIGLVGLVVATVLAARRLRWRINHTPRFYKDHCPRCGSHDLQRTPRRPFERRIANTGIPVRRYICVDCHWRGTRIESTLVPR